MAEQNTTAARATDALGWAPETKTQIQELIAQAGGKLENLFDKPKDETTLLVDNMVASVIEGKLVKGDLFKRINQAIALLDKRLSDQVNAIIHHPDFKALEGAWRGLEHLVKSKPPGQHIKVNVINMSKKELGSMLERYSAESGQLAWDQSPLFKNVFENRFDMPGGNPFGCLVGDYQFDKTAPDINALKRLSQICGAAHAPFLTASAPGMLGLKSWNELPNPAELEAKMSTPDYAAWNSLRQMDDARYLAITLPRMLARMPYGKDKNEVNGFNFEEDLRPVKGAEWAANETKHDNYVWANSAYAMAANLVNTFHDTGFCTAIRGIDSGGKVENLPIDTFPTDDGGVDSKCPTEVAISQRREAELGRLGFMPLSHWQNTDFAAFVGAQTVKKPTQYQDPRATENEELSARLPYVFLVSRFAHYIKKMIYEWVGTNMDRLTLQEEMNKWIMQYATSRDSTPEAKKEKPLADARIEIEEIPGKPGFYHAKAYLEPHIQLEGVTVDLGLVSKLPGAAG